MTDFAIAGLTLLPVGFAPATIIISDARIKSIQSGINAGADVKTDGWVIPGLIDLQINGAYGFDFTADSATASQVARRLPETGVTAFLPTIITSPLENYRRLTRDLEQAAPEAHGAQILGVHLEGPYLNPRRRGAHNANYLRTPNAAEIEMWANSALVRLVTLAPELPGALEMISTLRARGIVASAGHSDATYAQAIRGFQTGITWGTHLYNAMSPFTHREPGLAGALLSADVGCGMIIDGVHIHPAAVKTAFCAKGAGGITLVTDAMAAMGMGAGRYKLGDRDVVADLVSARLEDGTLAGSILQMDTAIRNMIAYTGCSLADAVAMASATPAQLLGLDHKGRLAPGCDADLVVLDQARRVEMTIARGEIVYQRFS